MIYKKMFFPIGGGDELEQRLYGATLVAKFFNVKLEILKCESNPIRNIPKSLNLPQHMQKEIQNIMNHQVNSEHNDFLILLKKVAKELDVPVAYFYCEEDILSELICALGKLKKEDQIELLNTLKLEKL